ncbi:hypothetical protein C0J52_02350 [Blattella germanica]|nr:hypothetical protein C0J52_02350 [Blattella germanica]PSN54971.1 hypothetical protein C0J52_02350 [Blattella germanica]
MQFNEGYGNFLQTNRQQRQSNMSILSLKFHLIAYFCYCKNLIIGWNESEKVRSFKYLESVIADNNTITEEVKSRLKAGNRCYRGLLPILRFKDLSKNGDKKIYRTMIRPVVTYVLRLGVY